MKRIKNGLLLLTMVVASSVNTYATCQSSQFMGMMEEVSADIKVIKEYYKKHGMPETDKNRLTPKMKLPQEVGNEVAETECDNNELSENRRLLQEVYREVVVLYFENSNNEMGIEHYEGTYKSESDSFGESQDQSLSKTQISWEAKPSSDEEGSRDRSSFWGGLTGSLLPGSWVQPTDDKEKQLYEEAFDRVCRFVDELYKVCPDTEFQIRM